MKAVSSVVEQGLYYGQPSKKFRFDDPAGNRRRGVSAAFVEGRARYHESLRMTRKFPQSAADKCQVQRRDIFKEAEVLSDPVAAVRNRMIQMLVMEQSINDELYQAKVIDHNALSASNKRLVELGQALKALPSQSAGENKGSQRSVAELIQDAVASSPALSVSGASVGDDMLKRASSAFGDGE